MKIKITLAKSAGFCFGVRRAINIALRAAREHSNIEMLGDIVHNEDVCRDMAKVGIKKAKELKPGKNKTLLLRAHGIPLKIMARAKEMGYEIIDATCPMVQEIHEIAVGMEAQRRQIIIIGDKNHVEVKGIAGQLNTKPLIVEAVSQIPLKKIKKIRKACVVVQSTQNIERVNKIVKILKRDIKDLRFFNTICATTRKKQTEIRILPLNNDVMVIIGSKTSANTRRLYEISKSLNRKSHWVQSSRDLKDEWFKGVGKVGISAGASTPDYTTREVIARIKELA